MEDNVFDPDVILDDFQKFNWDKIKSGIAAMTQ